MATELDIKAATTASSASLMPIVPLRHPWRWLGAVVVLALVGTWIYVIAGAEAFGWSTVGEYLFSPIVIDGIWSTLLMTVICMMIGTVIGTILAIMRLSPNPVLKAVSGGYIWFFRGVPTLVQLLFWFNLATILPKIELTIGGHQFFSIDTNNLMTPLVTVALGLGLSFAAFYSEVVRSGILSVDEGQIEAATAYGLTRAKTLRHIVLPQAMRVIIPPTGNELIGMLKWTAAGLIVAYGELLYSVSRIYSRTFEVIPMLMVATIWYLVMTTILSIGQLYVERYFARGSSRTQPKSIGQILRGAMGGHR